MLVRHIRNAIVVLVILAAAAPAGAAAFALDWRVTAMSPASGATFFHKSAVKVRCDWSAVIASTGDFNQAIEWHGMFVADGTSFDYFTVKYNPNGHWYFRPGSQGDKVLPWEERPVYGTATNEFKGAAETVWMANVVGPHTLSCVIARAGMGNPLESATKTANNSKEVSIVVNPMGQLTPGKFPHPPGKTTTGNDGRVPQKAPAQPVLPKPSLSIAGAQSKYDAGCSSLSSLVTVQVKIQNSNMPLGAGTGTVVVKESGGANLSSAAVPLPVIAPNQAAMLTIPIGTTAPFVGALPGKHPLTITLNPIESGGHSSFNKPAAYPLSITLPSGYCAGR